jgi:nucleotide-binding universal stress UspA family protein
MIRLDTILVAYDFSAHSEAALRTAISLARTSKGKIRLLHSCGLPVGGLMPYDAATIPVDVYDSIRYAAVERLDAVRRDAAAQGVDVTAEVTTIFPVEAVLEAVEKDGADLVVAGTRGLTGLKHAILGSTAERIVRLAPCPVLTVHDGAGALPRRVILATDFSDEGAYAMRQGAELAKRLEAEIHLVHAFDVPLEPVTRYGIAIPTDIVPLARDVARKKLDAAAGELGSLGMKVESHLTEVPAATAIAEVAKSLSADLIVMGTHGFTGLRHLLLGSVAERTLRLAPCAVLTMKSKAGGPA